MRIIKEFAKFNNVTIVSFEDNLDIDVNDPSYGTFDVELEYNGEEKNVSIPYELFLDFVYDKIPAFKSYSNSSNIEDMVDILKDAIEIGVDLKEWCEKYVSVHYTPEIFDKLTSLSNEEDRSGYDLDPEDDDMLDDWEADEDDREADQDDRDVDREDWEADREEDETE